MTLTEARDIVSAAATLLPLIHTRDKINIVRLLETTRAAGAVLRNRKASEAEKDEATQALKQVNAAMPATIAEAQQLSAEALRQLKKLTHTDGERKAIRLAPRRVRRQAARIVAKEERRRERQDRTET